MNQCPCGSNHKYLKCCGLYIEQQQLPPTPEALMRSRYCAYSMANVGYIKATMKGKALLGFNEQEAAQWASRVTWLGLQVLNAFLDKTNPNIGYVEFKAHFMDNDCLEILQEISQFERDAGRWFYSDGQRGHQPPQKQKIPRNGPCPCSSQKKFKNCHGKAH